MAVRSGFSRAQTTMVPSVSTSCARIMLSSLVKRIVFLSKKTHWHRHVIAHSEFKK